MQVISILNQKGGSGKTTLTTNLTVALINLNYKVLIADSDPQGSARDWNNGNENNLVSVVGLDRPSLAKDIKAIANGYHFILIDGAPQLSNQMAAAIKVSHIVLIPVQPSPYDIWATSSLVDAIKQRQALGTELNAFFVVSRAIKNTKLAKEVRGVLRDYDLLLFKNSTTQKVSYSNTAAVGKTVFQSNDKKAQLEIKNIANELLEVIKQ